MQAVPAGEAGQRFPDFLPQRQHLEQLAHLGRADELLRAGGERGVGGGAAALARPEKSVSAGRRGLRGVRPAQDEPIGIAG